MFTIITECNKMILRGHHYVFGRFRFVLIRESREKMNPCVILGVLRVYRATRRAGSPQVNSNRSRDPKYRTYK